MVTIKITKFYKSYPENSTNPADAVAKEETFTFPNFARLQYRILSPVTPAPLPEEDSSENVLIKIEGNTSVINISWKVKDEDTDRFYDEIKEKDISPTANVYDQIYRFQKFFRAKSIDDKYTLTIEYPNPLIFEGFVRDISFNTSDKENLTFNASMDFIEGNVATVFESDAPSSPINFSVTKTTTTSFTADWDTPLDNGSAAIDDYIVFYKRLGTTNWQESAVGGTTPTQLLVGSLVSGEKYLVYVRAKSTIGLGITTSRKVVDLA